MKDPKPAQTDAYSLILEAIDTGIYRPGDRLVESELAERFGVSRTPIREALQRLETQSMLARDGRSLMVASLDHNQLAELYVVRAELEGLAARLAARHATDEEVRVLRAMVEEDRRLLGDPSALSRANRRFHKQIHLASHNRYLVQQLDLVHRSMALMARTSLAAQGRDVVTLGPDATLADAAGLLAEKRIGALVVTDGDGRILGILSERDIVRVIGQSGATALDRKVSEVMTAKVSTCRETHTVIHVMEVMTRGRFRHLPVEKGGRLDGIVSIGDVVKRRIEEAVREVDQIREYIATA